MSSQFSDSSSYGYSVDGATFQPQSAPRDPHSWHIKPPVVEPYQNDRAQPYPYDSNIPNSRPIASDQIPLGETHRPRHRSDPAGTSPPLSTVVRREYEYPRQESSSIYPHQASVYATMQPISHLLYGIEQERDPWTPYSTRESSEPISFRRYERQRQPHAASGGSGSSNQNSPLHLSSNYPEGYSVPLSNSGHYARNNTSVPPSYPRAYEGKIGTPQTYLDPKFRRTQKARNFFKVGKVFAMLWSQPAGEDGDPSNKFITDGYSSGSFGEPIYSKIRRFVVVREGLSYCLALPITTYGCFGLSKSGPVKSEHAIIYTGKIVPLLLPAEFPQRGEEGVLSGSIRVDPDDMGTALDPLSRIDFGKVYTIEHNVKVRSFGMVNKDYKKTLIDQFLQTLHASVAETATASASLKGLEGQLHRDDEATKLNEQRNPLDNQHTDIKACAKKVALYFCENGLSQEAETLLSTLSSLSKNQTERGKADAIAFPATENTPDDSRTESSNILAGIGHVTLPSNYIDSPTEPFRCKLEACSKLEFSSTVGLLRHEREAHGMHGHGNRPHLCYYGGCERAVPGNGFPLRYNLFDHMKRVHNHRDYAFVSSNSPIFDGNTREGTLDELETRSREVG